MKRKKKSIADPPPKSKSKCPHPKGYVIVKSILECRVIVECGDCGEVISTFSDVQFCSYHECGKSATRFRMFNRDMYMGCEEHHKVFANPLPFAEGKVKVSHTPEA